MDTLGLKRIQSSLILILKERDDGTKTRQTLTNHLHWFELAKQHGCRVYKTTGTPCSCMLCQGNHYDRLDYKRTVRRIIKETLDD